MLGARVGDRLEGVERAGGDVARLCAHDRRPGVGGQRFCQRGGIHPALGIGGYPDRGLFAEAEQAQRGVDRGMRLLAAEDAERRCANQPVTLHIPALAIEDGIPRCGQARRVGALAAGDESDARGVRQAEQLQRPGRGDLLDGGRGRRQGVEGGVLIPRRDQPVRGERGGQCAADDEPEVPRARGGDQARFGTSGQRVDHRDRVLTPLGKLAAEHTADGARVGAGGYRSIVQCVEKRLCVGCGSAEAGGSIRHEPNLQLRTGQPRSHRTPRRSGTAWSRPGAAASSTAWPRRGLPPG